MLMSEKLNFFKKNFLKFVNSSVVVGRPRGAYPYEKPAVNRQASYRQAGLQSRY